MCTNGSLSGDGAYVYASCVVNDAPAMTGIYINADPKLIRYNGTSTISWNGGNAENCSVTGPNLSASGVNGTSVISGLTSDATYVLMCTLGPSTHTATTTVKVLPHIQET